MSNLLALGQRIRTLVPQIEEGVRAGFRDALSMLQGVNNPPGAIMQVARLVEGRRGLLGRIAGAHGHSLKGYNLEAQIEELAQNGILPPEIASDVHWIRIRANRARHNIEKAILTFDDAETALNRSMRVLEWFYCESERGPHLPAITEPGETGTAACTARAPAPIPLTVPGIWSARPTDDPEAPWRFGAETPHEVTLAPGEVYQLRVHEAAGDTDLVGLAALWGEPGLQSVDLSGCTRLTDEGLAHLRGLGNLQHVDLRDCYQITDAGLALLSGLTGLRQLDLGGYRAVTDVGLAYLRDLRALEWLNLRGCEEVTDAGLARLRELTNLRYLDLAWCEQITDAGLAHLQKLTALRYLGLRGCMRVTDAGLAHLRKLTGLHELDLDGCRRTTAAGRALLRGTLPKLRPGSI